MSRRLLMGRYGISVSVRRPKILLRLAALRHGLVSVLATAATTLLFWCAAGAASAQDFVEPEGTDPRVTIDRVVIGLLIIATILSLLTLAYVWHTQPQRRADAQQAKAAAEDPQPPIPD